MERASFQKISLGDPGDSREVILEEGLSYGLKSAQRMGNKESVFPLDGVSVRLVLGDVFIKWRGVGMGRQRVFADYTKLFRMIKKQQLS